MENQRGIGLEIEYQIVDIDTNKPVSKIQNIPSIVYIQNQIQNRFSSHAANVHAEQLSILCEIVSDVKDTMVQSYFQISEIANIIDQKILSNFNLKLLPNPVVNSNFEIVPASLDPNSRSFQLFNQWGADQILKTAICSMQINDSYVMPVYIGADDQVNHLLKFFRVYQENISKYLTLNTTQTFQNQNRIQISEDLLWNVKHVSFEYYGFEKNDLMIPTKVETNTDILKWMLAHNQIHVPENKLLHIETETILKSISPKNIHGHLKVKYDPKDLYNTWILEHRFLDASTSLENAQRFHEVFYHDLEIS